MLDKNQEYCGLDEKQFDTLCWVLCVLYELEVISNIDYYGVCNYVEGID